MAEDDVDYIKENERLKRERTRLNVALNRLRSEHETLQGRYDNLSLRRENTDYVDRARRSGDLLGGLSFQGKSLLDPSSLQVSGEDGVTHGPALYAHAIRQATQPGGALSALSANRAYSGRVAGILAAERSREVAGMRALQQSGASSQMAAAMYGENPYRAMQAIAPVRSEMATDLQENRFGALTSLAGMVQQAEGFQANVLEAELDRRAQAKAAREANKTALGAAGIGALGSYLGSL